MTVKAIAAILLVIAIAVYLAVGIFGGKEALPTGEHAGVADPGTHGDFGNVTQGPDGNPVNTAVPRQSEAGTEQ